MLNSNVNVKLVYSPFKYVSLYIFFTKKYFECVFLFHIKFAFEYIFCGISQNFMAPSGFCFEKLWRCVCKNIRIYYYFFGGMCFFKWRLQVNNLRCCIPWTCTLYSLFFWNLNSNVFNCLMNFSNCIWNFCIC